MDWPTNLLDPSYGPLVLGAITSKEYALTWATLSVSDGGHVVEMLFSTDALKVDGVRVNVSATLQQQIADAIGALLPTPKIMDLAWLSRAATLRPAILPIASTSAAMEKASAQLDAEIIAAGAPSGILLSQKTWCIGNSLLTHPGKAMNYGFFVIPNQPGEKWSGIGTEACVSFPLTPAKGRVIQGQGWAHDAGHLDYSQCCWLVSRNCIVDGSARDLADVLTDGALAGIVSHEGPLRVLRQPGVVQFACPTPPLQLAAKVAAGFQPRAYGLCPAGPAPVMTSSSTGAMALAALLGAAAGVGAVLWASR